MKILFEERMSTYVNIYMVGGYPILFMVRSSVISKIGPSIPILGPLYLCIRLFLIVLTKFIEVFTISTADNCRNLYNYINSKNYVNKIRLCKFELLVVIRISCEKIIRYTTWKLSQSCFIVSHCDDDDCPNSRARREGKRGWR